MPYSLHVAIRDKGEECEAPTPGSEAVASLCWWAPHILLPTVGTIVPFLPSLFLFPASPCFKQSIFSQYVQNHLFPENKFSTSIIIHTLIIITVPINLAATIQHSGFNTRIFQQHKFIAKTQLTVKSHNPKPHIKIIIQSII